MVEEVVEARPAGLAVAGGASRALAPPSSEAVPLSKASAVEEPRTPVTIAELDRLLGGGIVPGQVVLLAGPPGIGKSTLMLQAAAALAQDRKVLYATGEESLKQVATRAKRLGLQAEQLHLLAETSLLKILEAVGKFKPEVLIVDSIQTALHPEFASSPGSVAQVRECASQLVRLAKSTDCAVFVLGHVTKDGTLAGPKVLEHVVDTVLYFDTERHDLLRVLRAHKNRFGPTDETGLFEMGERGLKEVANVSALFLESHGGPAKPGRAISVTMEGSRPMLVEVQSLVACTKYPLPRRMSTGLDLNRVLVLLAALEKHARLRLEDRDVFVSLAGGLRLKDPALDLAACLSVLGCARDAAIPSDCVLIGEVGLLGDIGRVPQLETRLKEAARAGFKKALVPERSVKDLPRNLGITVRGAGDIAQAADMLFE